MMRISELNGLADKHNLQFIRETNELIVLIIAGTDDFYMKKQVKRANFTDLILLEPTTLPEKTP
ncbi:hypothetical protein Hanom_Chr05g00469101 [Helianthus anomalus]